MILFATASVGLPSRGERYETRRLIVEWAIVPVVAFADYRYRLAIRRP